MSKHRSGQHEETLCTYVDGFIQDLARLGYKEKTQKHYKWDIRRFIAYCECHGIRTSKQFVDRAHRLVSGFPGSQYARFAVQASMNRFTEYLVRNGIALPPDSKPKNRYDQLAYEFAQFQLEHRGICPTYAKVTRRFTNIFFDYLVPVVESCFSVGDRSDPVLNGSCAAWLLRVTSRMTFFSSLETDRFRIGLYSTVLSLPFPL